MDLVKETATADAEMIMRGYLALARLQQACEQSTRARETLDAFALVSRQRGFAPALLAHGAAVRAQVDLAQGNLAAALRWVDTSGLFIYDEHPGYLQERAYLTLARIRIVQGRTDPVGPFLHEALDLLSRLLDDAQAKARMNGMLEILILRALAFDARGNRTESLAALSRALTLAEPEGYIRLFLDEGVPMVTLLRHAYEHTMAPAYVATLLEAAGEPITVDSSHPSSHSSPLIEPLTMREREVLQLLMDGASNREIASQLVLSVNTVKKHVLNLCGKLNVQSRAHAIAKARTLHL
jgi:LuxR family maltose regulon positive regulatory protein